MKDNGFYVVQGWMVNKLKLKGNNLHIFAIIFGFSKDGQSVYNGGNKYLRDTIGSTKNTVIKCLATLMDAGFICRNEIVRNNITFYEYWYNAPVVQKLVQGGAEIEQKGGAETAPNSISIHNIEDKKSTPHVPAGATMQGDLFGNKPNPSKKTLFENSAYFEFDIFIKKLEKAAALGIDLDYYHRAINNWSTSKNQKRTGKGWIATARTWMEKDKDNKKLRMVENASEKQTNDAQMVEFLNM